MTNRHPDIPLLQVRQSKAFAHARPYTLRITPNHFHPHISWPPSWPCTYQLQIYTFPHSIPFIVLPYHLIKIPQPVSQFYNTVNPGFPDNNHQKTS